MNRVSQISELDDRRESPAGVFAPAVRWASRLVLGLIVVLLSEARLSAQVVWNPQLYGHSNVNLPHTGLFLLDPQSANVLQSLAVGDPETVPAVGLANCLAGGRRRLWSVATAPVGLPTLRIVSIRQADAQVELDWSTGVVWGGLGIDVHPISERIYLAGRPGLGSPHLYEFDPISMQLLTVAPITGTANDIAAFAISPTGQAYVFGPNGPTVWRLDLSTGVTSSQGVLAFPGQPGFVQDSAFDPTGILWLSYVSIQLPQHSGIYRVDLSTLNFVKVKQMASPYYGLAWGEVPTTTVYCQSKPTSQGCTPTISTRGYACSAAVSGFWVQADDLPNRKPGFLMYSTSGAQSLPFQGGVLCLASPIRRGPVLDSGGSAAPANDCTGSWSIDFNAFHASWLHVDAVWSPPLIAPGTTVWAQWWGRDPGYPSAFASVLTDAVEFVMEP